MDLTTWDKVVEAINKNLAEVDTSFKNSLEILTLNPFDSKIAVAASITTGIKGIALTLVSLFFVIQFCNEAMYLRIKSYEQVFKLIFKFFLAKALVDNATGLMGIIYNEFTKLTLAISAESKGILSTFKADAILVKPAEKGAFSINYLVAQVTANIDIYILKAACWVIALVLIGRLFEVIIYATVAPIPLATVAGEGWSESSKNFIKGFAAVCLQSLIIVVMFSAFNGISQLMADGSHKLGMTVTALSLALGVTKSGQWARTAVGL